MIPMECKRLAEVDFPIAKVSQHSASGGRDGQPSTLHLWWARRPLPACRSVLLGLLLPDPADPHCPEGFKQRARNILPSVQGKPDDATDKTLQAELLRFLADFARTENCSKAIYLEACHGLIRAAFGDEAPLVVDSFAGGGSIPLEALRLGCETFASDTNPVASLVLKCLLEDIPRHGDKLAEELDRVTPLIQAAAEKELEGVYSVASKTGTPVTYLWARTIVCDHCGSELPLIRSFWLSKKANRKRALRCKILKHSGKPSQIEFEVFVPEKDSEVHPPTVVRAKATCPSCNLSMLPDRVRLQLVSQNGGASTIFDKSGKRISGATLLAVVEKKDGIGGNEYRVAVASDYEAVWRATNRLLEFEGFDEGESSIPTEQICIDGIRNIWVLLYGVTKWHQLFTRRQCLTIVAYQRAAAKVQMSTECRRLVALAQDRLVMMLSAHCRWKPTGESLIDMFGRHSIGMVWDFAEGTPGYGVSSIFSNWCGQFSKLIHRLSGVYQPGQTMTADACTHPLSDSTCDVWFTDPPYYDAIPYAHLSDCFYVWLRRSGLREHMPSEFGTVLTPKESECIVDRPHALSHSKKNAAFFEEHIGIAAKEGRRITSESGAACIVFAHKTTEGWEALLSGIIGAGWRITASWPIATELASRLNARDTASLATSVHLVCRPRAEDAEVGDWAEVFRELPLRVGAWIERLQKEGVRGADLVFACIGPAIEIYSRYRKVEDAEGREIPLGGDPTASEPFRRGFLAYVWETVGRLALEQVLGTAEARARNGAAGALEEDSRLTALFLWTLQTTEMMENGAENERTQDDEEDDDEEDEPKKKKTGLRLVYDVVRRFAQPLGIHLERWEHRVIDKEKGVVRLIPVRERSEQLFGEADASAISKRIEQDLKASRNYEFAFMQDVAAPPAIKSRGRRRAATAGAVVEDSPAVQTVTTLDRVHAAMLLQASGQANGLRAMLKEEQQRGADFLRLANALSALYPKNSEEKRLLDAMLLAVPKN